MRTNTAKEKLLRGETIYGVFANGVSPEMMEILGLAGFDFITIDSEHAPSSDETNRLLIMAAECRNTPVFIRTSNKLDSSILRSLDIGAQGLLLPQVNSPEEAEKIVRAAKYYPQGSRGVGLGRGADYGMGIDLADYFKHANDNLLIAVQCENIAGLPYLDAIAAVPGVDSIFAGPFDLSQSMGVPGQIDAPQVREVIDRVLQISARYGKYAGIFTFSVEQAKEYAGLGFRYIIAGSDLHYLSDGCAAAVKALKDKRR
jgi:4-hydroxy-2-oxoheptanedioate aldolase